MSNIPVACGKCYACQATRRSEWQVRLAVEHRNSKYSLFVTLTYDDDNLFYLPGSETPSLDKRAVQLFFKRLRRSLKDARIRYYAVGEYGTNSFRPHYHILLFSDCTFDIGYISDSWGLGNIQVGKVSDRSISYCVNYVTVNPSDLQKYSDLSVEKPFALMSRRPGIGAQYFQSGEMVDYHEDDPDRHFVVINGQKKKMPRYYSRKIYSARERQKFGERMSYVQQLRDDAQLEKDGSSWYQKMAEYHYFRQSLEARRSKNKL